MILLISSISLFLILTPTSVDLNDGGVLVCLPWRHPGLNLASEASPQLLQWGDPPRRDFACWFPCVPYMEVNLFRPSTVPNTGRAGSSQMLRTTVAEMAIKWVCLHCLLQKKNLLVGQWTECACFVGRNPPAVTVMLLKVNAFFRGYINHCFAVYVTSERSQCNFQG